MSLTLSVHTNESVTEVQIKRVGKQNQACGMSLPRGSTPGFAGTGLNCGGPLGPGVLDSWDIGVPGFIPGVLDFSLWNSGNEVLAKQSSKKK